ncbi:hypothetical protein CTI12_AA620650 [Artemisia annua]|uniref:Uncharacterized protein n=1 Tax=Artemisia annua TaxID=35608 RepID=A0A2U1KBV7_ARTAN|nr:hypothetical protein CTI12_AA620650 [Artemisia annua]
MVENLGNKTDRELLEFIWMNKRNVGILEQKRPEKAVAIKEAIKCYEDEIERRARLQLPKENGTGPVKCIRPVNIEVDYKLRAPYKNVDDNMVEDGNAVGGENTETHDDVNKEKTSPQVDDIKLVIKVEDGEQSLTQNESIDGIIAEEERAGTLQTVPVNGDKNQASSIQDRCAELKKVSCVLSMLDSPNKFYSPQGDPLDEEAEKAKQTLIELLNKNFETIVGSPDEEKVKFCIKILTKNLHKLPRFQGRVIETLNIEFDSTCRNWKMCHTNHQSNIAFEMKQGDNLGVLKECLEKDMEIESKIETVDADIFRLKAELLEKELTRETLVKQKSDLFHQSKMPIDDAKKLLQEMVTVKLQSDVAVDNMNELAAKWERIRENFKLMQG